MEEKKGDQGARHAKRWLSCAGGCERVEVEAEAEHLDRRGRQDFAKRGEGHVLAVTCYRVSVLIPWQSGRAQLDCVSKVLERCHLRPCRQLPNWRSLQAIHRMPVLAMQRCNDAGSTGVHVVPEVPSSMQPHPQILSKNQSHESDGADSCEDCAQRHSLGERRLCRTFLTARAGARAATAAAATTA